MLRIFSNKHGSDPDAGSVHAGRPVDIGSRLELFVDDYLIEKMDGVELRLNHPVRREVALYFDAPWEGPWSAYVTIFEDSDGYRMYYRGCNYGRDKREHTCVALSEDGIHWTRPKLGLFDFEGDRETNIVWVGQGAHAFSPFIDTNLDCKPEERYKAVAPDTGSAMGAALFAYTSSDGFKWARMSDQPIITDGHFDSHNIAYWDTLRGEYACYFRKFRGGTTDGVRDIRRATSKDFLKWSEPEWLNYTGSPDEQLYTNAISPYYRAPHFYLGFPKRFFPTRRDHGQGGLSDGVFMSSRDGLNFHRWREAFIRPGPDIENWVDRNQMASWGMLELKPGQVSLYYLEHNYVRTHNVTRTTIRTDGFVSLHSGGETGTVLTRPFKYSGAELVINYSTSAAGGVRVEVEGEDCRPLKGFALDDCPISYGDEIEHVVKWNSGSDLRAWAGRPVRLKFEMDDADIYSMRFR